MSKESIKELNNLLRGCEMGVDNYQKFAEDTDDMKLRELFKEYKSNYATHVSELAERVTSLGGDPKYGSGIGGVMSSISYAAKGMDGHSPSELLKTAHYGESMALDGCEKILASSAVDEESKNIVKCQVSEIKDRQEQLVDLIRDYDSELNS